MTKSTASANPWNCESVKPARICTRAFQRIHVNLYDISKPHSGADAHGYRGNAAGTSFRKHVSLSLSLSLSVVLVSFNDEWHRSMKIISRRSVVARCQIETIISDRGTLWERAYREGSFHFWRSCDSFSRTVSGKRGKIETRIHFAARHRSVLRLF